MIERIITAAELRTAIAGAPHNRDAILSGSMPVYADRAGTVRLLVPRGLTDPDVPVAARAPTPKAAPRDPSVEVLAELAPTGEDPDIAAFMRACGPNRSAHAPVAPRLEARRSASDVVLEEIEKLSRQTVEDEIAAVMPKAKVA